MSQQQQISDITITDYSEKSFVVRGETRQHKETIKALGGKWNSNLKDGSGWIFPVSKKAAVKEWINTGECSVNVTKRPTERYEQASSSNTIERELRSLREKIDRLTKLFESKDSKIGMDDGGEDSEPEIPPKRLLKKK